MPESGAALKRSAARDSARHRAWAWFISILPRCTARDASRSCSARRFGGIPRETALHCDEGSPEQRELSRNARGSRAQPAATSLPIISISTSCIGPVRIRSTKRCARSTRSSSKARPGFVGVSNFEADEMLEAASYLRRSAAGLQSSALSSLRARHRTRTDPDCAPACRLRSSHTRRLAEGAYLRTGADRRETSGARRAQASSDGQRKWRSHS